jgi:histidinol-phosphatase (PHP family)
LLSNNDFNRIDRKTWNGHTHTEFCPHGSGEDTEDFIKAAIQAGFKTYSVTEHFPMPPDFYEHAVGSRHAIYTAAMSDRELPEYLRKMNRLKEKYADKIRLLIGFEIDYFSQYQRWTAQMLDVYGSAIDDAILSVHFLPTVNGLRAIDDSDLDFRTGVLAAYGTPVGVANAYLKTVAEAIDWQVTNKPQRYGHIMLYRKWRNLFDSRTVWEDHATRDLLKHILQKIAARHEFLDCNMAGLFRTSQTESSPNFTWLAQAQQFGIPLVYGADAHRVADVAQGYNTYLENGYDK